MYSAIKAEVVDPMDIRTNVNEGVVSKIKLADKVVVCGQALSHCVNFTMRDIIPHWNRCNADLILLTDCCSSVYGFDKVGEDFIYDMKTVGITVCKSPDVFNIIEKSRLTNDLSKSDTTIESNESIKKQTEGLSKQVVQLMECNEKMLQHFHVV
jgi:hypothetical protein